MYLSVIAIESRWNEQRVASKKEKKRHFDIVVGDPWRPLSSSSIKCDKSVVFSRTKGISRLSNTCTCNWKGRSEEKCNMSRKKGRRWWRCQVTFHLNKCQRFMHKLHTTYTCIISTYSLLLSSIYYREEKKVFECGKACQRQQQAITTFVWSRNSCRQRRKTFTIIQSQHIRQYSIQLPKYLFQQQQGAAHSTSSMPFPSCTDMSKQRNHGHNAPSSMRTPNRTPTNDSPQHVP